MSEKVNQLLLPIKNLHVPARHVEWVKQANAADYWEKRDWFYPFKTKFLRAHAISDGLDLQVITDKCWCGDGIWRGFYYNVPEIYWRSCYRCHGTGVHRVRKVVLIRWSLGGVIFHEPSSLVADEGAGDFRRKIKGLIKHPSVDATTGRRAMLKLLLRYDRPRLYHLARGKWRRWLGNQELKVRWTLRRWRYRWTREDDIPF